jgi:hypothetical protein
MTPHGFIEDSEKALKHYKDTHVEEWKAILGGENFNIIEEETSEVNVEMFTNEPE